MSSSPLPRPETRPTPPSPVTGFDWAPERARALGDQALALWEEFLRRLPELPVVRRAAEAQVRAAVTLPIPEEPLPQEEIFTHLRELMFEHSAYTGHPRFLAYINGPGTIPSAVGDMLAAVLNQNVGGWRMAPGATEIQQHLMRWFASEFGLPSTAGGVLTAGGAMANLVALKAARDARADWNVRKEGLLGHAQRVLYASTEAHVVIDRAADMLGLGSSAVRHIPVDENFRMQVPALRKAIEEDLAAGLIPFAVAGTAGTTQTGSIDPLAELAGICAEYGLWFHVDAAYGGPAVLVPELKALMAGIELADSIAFDLHKWFYTSHSGGCVLVREMKRLSSSFSIMPNYIHEDKELTGRGIDLAQYGVQFSQPFSSLKVWLSLLAHGRSGYARRIAHDVELTRYLDALVRQRQDFEATAPTSLSVACFRYVPPTLRATGPEREAYLNLLNERLMAEVQLDGRAYPSNAILRGQFCLRICIVNFRTEAKDLELLLDVTAELGERLDAQLRPEALK